MSLADVDLFAEGAQEHWYEAYSILHAECPVVRLEGEKRLMRLQFCLQVLD